MSAPPVLPGAEPWSCPGGPHGALVLHGFTGSPQSMRGLAEAFGTAGFAVELPRLPGHGTTVEDMATTDWSDWSAAADAAYRELAERCEKVVVAGLSMGGTLALWLAAAHPGVSGVVAVNAALGMADPAMEEGLNALLAEGSQFIPGVGGDLADPDAHELAYDMVPVRCLLSLGQALGDLEARLDRIRCPILVMNSPQDHIVPPAASDQLAAGVSGPVERVTLERSYHVATLDYDAALIQGRAVEWAVRVTS